MVDYLYMFMDGKLYLKISKDNIFLLEDLENITGKYTWIDGERLYNSTGTKMVVENGPTYLCMIGSNWYAHNHHPSEEKMSLEKFLNVVHPRLIQEIDIDNIFKE